MPKPGPNCTTHKKKDSWEYWSYPFSPTVLIAERNLKWYDEERFEDLQYELKQEKVRFFWAEASDTSHSYTKKNCRVELYKRYPKDTPFEHKVEDMKQIIDRYEL